MLFIRFVCESVRVGNNLMNMGLVSLSILRREPLEDIMLLGNGRRCLLCLYSYACFIICSCALNNLMNWIDITADSTVCTVERKSCIWKMVFIVTNASMFFDSHPINVLKFILCIL